MSLQPPTGKERRRRADPRSDTSADRYAAFISYSHAVDGELAPGIQRGLQQFAKPWNRVRALRVFRDETSLSADPALWSAIERALASSNAFILMASPEAAQSRWVAREAAWWCENRDQGQILIALTGGELAWSDTNADFDWNRTTALPDVLRGVFQSEPKWVDFRWAREGKDVSLRHPQFRQCIADLASPLHGRPRDELIGEDISAHRRTMRLARSAVAVLVCLTLLAVTGGLVALKQRNTARDQTRLAMARQIAVSAGSNVSARLDVAQLLAVEGFRLRRTPQTEAALFQSVAASPHLVRFGHQGESITAIAAARHGQRVASGGADGSVVIWDQLGETRQRLEGAGGRVNALGFDRDGELLAVGVDDAVVLYNPSGGTHRVAEWGMDEPVTAIAVGGSPTSLAILQGGKLALLNAQSGEQVAAADAPVGALGLSLADDGKSLLVTTGVGSVSRWTVPDLDPLGPPTSLLTPAGAYVEAYSGDGTFFGYIKNGRITVTKLEGENDVGEFPQLNTVDVEAFAVSAAGDRVAVASGGAISIVDAVVELLRPTMVAHLTGMSRIDDVSFLGSSGERLVSIQGEKLAFWDLTRPSGLAQDLGVKIPDEANIAIPPRNAVRPDGRQLAWLDERHRLMILELPSGEQPVEVDVGGMLGGVLTYELAYSADGKLLAVAGDGGGEIWDVSGETPRHISGWRDQAQTNSMDPSGVVSLGFLHGRDELAVVNSRGRITIRDARSGELRRLLPTSASDTHLYLDTAAISPVGPFLAICSCVPAAGDWPQVEEGSTNKGLQLVDLDTGAVHQGPPVPDGAASLTFAPTGSVLVSQVGGVTEWDPSTGRSTSLSTDPYVRMAVSPDGELLVGLTSAGAIEMWRRTTRERVGTVYLPPPTLGLGTAGAGDQTDFGFTQDGKALFTTTAGGNALRWAVTEDQWIQVACRRAARELTDAEWLQYIGTKPPADLACMRAFSGE